MTDRFRESLAKTREAVQEGLDRVLKGQELEPATLEELEAILLQADLGVETTESFIEAVREQARRGRLTDGDVRQTLAAHLREALKGAAAPLALEARPAVVLVLGVNGSGKTTTCGKLAWQLRASGGEVLLAAADTFRAAAIDQLERWGERVGVPVVKQGPGADPSAVAFDAVKAAQARRVDVLIVDTAGRLHTKTNLMAELQKVKRVIGRQVPGAPHEILLVLDATTGQNGIAQARLFHEALTLTGLVLTKLDGTAKGGIIVRIARELSLPIKLVGTGERPEDLAPFDPEAFVAALVGA
ncbi:MAG: signal recognition particle-docking protein FtsY [Candidatus Rokubacteria bacterium]|nr:signal recognition particle-docking protein FtsY [Candidatus Rokubacteria bacterium]